jgi:hypothetical protein
MSYKIYLDKEETFECEASIKNSSYKNAKARLIIESNDVNLVFYGNIDKNTISVPIKTLNKYFTEKDSAKIKLEVIVENQLVTPWESEVEFETYNKVEIKEVKNTIKSEPLVEVKVKEEKKTDIKQELLKTINEQFKNKKISKLEKRELIKNLLKNSL